MQLHAGLVFEATRPIISSGISRACDCQSTILPVILVVTRANQEPT